MKVVWQQSFQVQTKYHLFKAFSKPLGPIRPSSTCPKYPLCNIWTFQGGGTRFLQWTPIFLRARVVSHSFLYLWKFLAEKQQKMCVDPHSTCSTISSEAELTEQETILPLILENLDCCPNTDQRRRQPKAKTLSFLGSKRCLRLPGIAPDLWWMGTNPIFNLRFEAYNLKLCGSG